MSLPKLPNRPAWGLALKWTPLAVLGALTLFGTLYQASELAPRNTVTQAWLTAALTAAYAGGMAGVTVLLGRLGVRRASVVASAAGAAIDGVAAAIPSVRLFLVVLAPLTAVLPTYALMYAGQLAKDRGGTELTDAVNGRATALLNVGIAGGTQVLALIAALSNVSDMLWAMVAVQVLAATLSYRWIGADAEPPGRYTTEVLGSRALRRVLGLSLAVGFGVGTAQTAGLVQATVIGLPTKWLVLTTLIAVPASLLVARWVRHASRTWMAILALAAVAFVIGAFDPSLPGHALKVTVLFVAYTGVQAATAGGYAAVLSVGVPPDPSVRATEMPMRTTISFLGMIVATPMVFLMLHVGFAPVCVLCALGFTVLAVLVLSWGRDGFARTDGRPADLVPNAVPPAVSPTVAFIHARHEIADRTLRRATKVNGDLYAYAGTRRSDGSQEFDRAEALAELHSLRDEVSAALDAAQEAYDTAEAVYDGAAPLLDEWVAHHTRNPRTRVLVGACWEIQRGVNGFTVRIEVAEPATEELLDHLAGDLEVALESEGFPEPLAVTVTSPPPPAPARRRRWCRSRLRG